MSERARLTRRSFILAASAAGVMVGAGGLSVLFRRQSAPLVRPLPTSTPFIEVAGSAVASVLSGAPALARPAALEPDGYVATAPRVLRRGQTETVAVSLFRGEEAAAGPVAVALLQDGQRLVEATAEVNGRGTVHLPALSLADGEYVLQVQAAGDTSEAPVRVEDGTILFLETDKPIYKPGETVHVRVLAVDAALRPSAGEATVEAADAKGIKVFKKVVPVDDFGMATVDLPLSTEPNLGVWKLTAGLGRRTAQRDVRIERYVLPKYEVQVNLERGWTLASDPIRGTVAAEYSFGRPVRGEAVVTAFRYVGTWQPYFEATLPLDGRGEFEVPPVQYAAGTPTTGGLSNVRLDVTVREQSTGYEESTSRQVPVAPHPCHGAGGAREPDVQARAAAAGAGDSRNPRQAALGPGGRSARDLPGRGVSPGGAADPFRHHQQRHSAGGPLPSRRRGGPHGRTACCQRFRGAAYPARGLLAQQHVRPPAPAQSGSAPGRRVCLVPGVFYPRSSFALLRGAGTRPVGVHRRYVEPRHRDTADTHAGAGGAAAGVLRYCRPARSPPTTCRSRWKAAIRTR